MRQMKKILFRFDVGVQMYTRVFFGCFGQDSSSWTQGNLNHQHHCKRTVSMKPTIIMVYHHSYSHSRQSCQRHCIPTQSIAIWFVCVCVCWIHLPSCKWIFLLIYIKFIKLDLPGQSQARETNKQNNAHTHTPNIIQTMNIEEYILWRIHAPDDKESSLCPSQLNVCTMRRYYYYYYSITFLHSK